MDSLLGRTLGNYRIVEQIGRGGMATVYKGYHSTLARYVAIKVLPDYFAHDPTFFERFLQEAQAVASLRHRHITQVFDFGRENETVYLVIEYVEGGTLQDRMGKPLPMGDALRLTQEVADALGYAHSRGIIHRDVKPSNILLSKDGEAVLSDFGIAKMVERAATLTKVGMGVGTPEYMAPEQGTGVGIDGRADIYSLGIVLFEMVTGQVPYTADTPMAIVLRHLNDPLPLPRRLNPAIPEAIEEIIVTCLAKDPNDRYQTAADLIQAVNNALATENGGLEGERTLVSVPKPRQTPWPTPREAQPKTPPAARVKTPPPAEAGSTVRTKTPPPVAPQTPAPDGAAKATSARTGRRRKTPPSAPVVQPPPAKVAATPSATVQPHAQSPAISPIPAQVRARPAILPGAAGLVVYGAAGLVVVVLLAVVALGLSHFIGGWVNDAATPTSARVAGLPHPAAPASPTAAPVVATTAGPAAPATSTPVTVAGQPGTAMGDLPAGATTAAPAATATSGKGGPGPTVIAVSTAIAPAGQIVYADFRGPDKFGDFNIWSLSLSGGEPRLLAEYASYPTVSPDGTHILFYSWLDGGLFTMRLDGSEHKRISNSKTDAYPAWSPDGRRIAFESSENILVMNADGSGRFPIIEGGSGPSWSSDGKQIVYVGCVSSRCGLVITDADGKNHRLITDEASDASPDWLPGGNTILFTSRRGGHNGIWTVGADGSDIREIAIAGRSDREHLGSARWAMQGQGIVFRSDRDGTWGIYITNADGSNPRRIVRSDVSDDWWREPPSWTK